MNRQDAMRLRNRDTVLLREDCALCRVFMVWARQDGRVAIAVEHPRLGYMNVSQLQVI